MDSAGFTTPHFGSGILINQAMRHRTTTTTERYDARIRADDAFAELEWALDRPAVKVLTHPKPAD